MRKLIAYVLLVCLTVYTAILYNSEAMIFFAGVEFLLPLFLFAGLFLQSLRLKTQLQIEGYFCEQGEERKLALMVWNKSPAPMGELAVKIRLQNLTTHEKRKLWLKQSLSPGENVIVLPEWPLKSGIWEVAVTKLRIYDWWKFWALPMRRPKALTWVQLPQAYQVHLEGSISEHEPLWESEKYHPYKSGNDSSHIREIREYRPGDKLNAIHWKLSAGREELLVKEYGLPMGAGLLLGISVPELTEDMLSLIYSLMKGCREISLNLVLVWKSAREEEIHSQTIFEVEELYPAMEALMLSPVTVLREEQKPSLPARQLWLQEACRLTLNGELVGEFNQENLQEKLLDMELML